MKANRTDPIRLSSKHVPTDALEGGSLRAHESTSPREAPCRRSSSKAECGWSFSTSPRVAPCRLSGAIVSCRLSQARLAKTFETLVSRLPNLKSVPPDNKARVPSVRNSVVAICRSPWNRQPDQLGRGYMAFDVQGNT